MFDLLLFAMIALPPLGAMLAGRYVERGLTEAPPEVQAQRKYRLSWLLFLIMQVQVVALLLLIANYGERMELVIRIGHGILERLDVVFPLRTHTSIWVATMAVTVLTMAVIGGYYTLFYLPLLRVDRIIKRTQNSAARKAQVRLTLRGTLGGLLPMVLWFGMVAALPNGFLGDTAHLVMVLAGFILIVHSLSPWLVQLANPTAPLPAEHPVTRMAMDLGRDAGVRIEAVRVMTLGEAKIANALVSGLWPWLRRIYVTDHMLATFSVAEIRAILAHEVGHIRHRHLWWYFAIAIGGALIIPRMIDAIGQLNFLHQPVWGFLFAFSLYWGVMFKFFSRHFERQADRFAIAATGDMVMFQSALEKLAEVNGMVKQYSKWDIFQTHPPIAERVRSLGKVPS
jgi:STE24 endopeptidase